MLTGIDSAGGTYVAGYDIYMGYVTRTPGGHTPTYITAVAWAAHEGVRALSITTTSNWTAIIFDIESGAESLNNAVAFFNRQTSTRPVMYVAASMVNTLVAVMTQAGIARTRYRILSAHYTKFYGEHICGPTTCGPSSGVRYACDGTQWDNTVAGLDTYDVSILLTNFLTTTEETTMSVSLAMCEVNNQLHIAVGWTTKTSKKWTVHHYWQNNGPGATTTKMHRQELAQVTTS